MDQIMGILIDRLVGKGMKKSTISPYIRDLENTLEVNTPVNLQELNRRLQLLGWDDFELDDHTLQLIIASLEIDDFNTYERRSSLEYRSPIDIIAAVET